MNPIKTPLLATWVVYNNKTVAQEIYEFLMSPNTRYEDYFERDYEFGFPLEEDKSIYKRIMMLIIAECSFKYQYHDVKKGILEEENSNLYMYLEGDIDYKQIIEMFYDQEFLSDIYTMILDYIEYMDMGYLIFFESAKMLLEDDLIETLLRINPFAVLDYIDLLDTGELTDAEEAIQNCLDAYAVASRRMSFLEQDTEKTVEYSDFIDAFLEKIREYYQENEDDVSKVIAYMIANVYEFCGAYSKSQEKMNLFLTMQKEQNQPEKLVNMFYNDPNFCREIIEAFYDANAQLNLDELEERREKYKSKYKEEKILKLLNPFYTE